MLLYLGAYWFFWVTPDTHRGAAHAAPMSAGAAKASSSLRSAPWVPTPPQYAPTGEQFYANITVHSSIGEGNVIIRVHREWAPLGAERFHELLQANYYDEARFFRVLKVIMCLCSDNLIHR